MNYTYNLNFERKTIDVVINGICNTTELKRIEFLIRLKANELKYRIVFDYRQLNINSMMSELYFWFTSDYFENDNTLKYIQTAYLVDKEYWNKFLFFECTSSNKGITIKVFLEENALLDWLKC